jgi:hypothetical protein
MQIDAAEAGDLEQFLRQYQTVSHHNQQIGPQGAQRREFPGILEASRLMNRQVMLEGQLFDGTGRQLAAAARGSIRLAVDRDDVSAAVGKQRSQ